MQWPNKEPQSSCATPGQRSIKILKPSQSWTIPPFCGPSQPSPGELPLTSTVTAALKRVQALSALPVSCVIKETLWFEHGSHGQGKGPKILLTEAQPIPA
jgi:hypothetical protein